MGQTWIQSKTLHTLRTIACTFSHHCTASSIMVTSKLVNVCNCPFVRQAQQQFLKASIDLTKKKNEVNKALMISICNDTCTCFDAWPLYSMIDIRRCTRFIEKFLCRSRMAVHKPTMAVSRFLYVFFLDFDGGRLTVAQLLSKYSSVGVVSCNSSRRDSQEKLWSASGLVLRRTELHLKVHAEVSSR